MFIAQYKTSVGDLKIRLTRKRKEMEKMKDWDVLQSRLQDRNKRGDDYSL